MDRPDATPPGAAIWLAREARPLLLQDMTRDNCIESTAAACDFLRWAGVAARPLPVETMLFNAAGWRLYRQNIMLDSPSGHTIWELQGAWSVGLIASNGPRPGRYAGHLVALVGERWVLDLSLDQADRPQKNLRVHGPLLAELEIDPGADDGGYRPLEDDAGLVVIYRPNRSPWAPTYKQAPGWTRKPQRRMLLDRLIAAFKARESLTH